MKVVKKATRSVKQIHAVRAAGSVSSISRKDAALLRLNVTPQQLAAAPPITSLLKQAHGGIAQVLEAMRLSTDALIVTFLRKYDSIPVEDREHLPIEAFALAAGIDIHHLLGAVMLALQSQSVNAVKIIATSAHPRITQARVTYGLLPLGERDRTALNTAMGFLPSPKGPTFIGQAVFTSGQWAKDDGDEEDGELPENIDVDKLFPPAVNMQNKLTAIRQHLPPEPEKK